MPHINYSLLAWGTKCQKIELLQMKAVRAVHSKSPIAHTNPLFRKMNNLMVSDLYTCNLVKMYYKLYQNMLPIYFKSFIPEYGDYRHNLRNDQIRLPLIRCEYGEMNLKYHMQFMDIQCACSSKCLRLEIIVIFSIINWNICN